MNPHGYGLYVDPPHLEVPDGPMSDEQRKWYAMGANDMEAGRLVTKENLFPPCCYDDLGNEGRGCQLLVERAVENESLREQLALAARRLNDLVGQVAEQEDRAGAAETKLAEAEEQLRQAEERASDADADWRACYDKLKVTEANLENAGRLGMSDARRARDEIKKLEAKLAEANERLDEFWHEAQDRKAKLAEAHSLAEQDDERMKRTLDRLAGVEKTLKEMRAAHADQYRRAESAEARLVEVKGWHDELATKLAEATEDLDSCREVREELEARLAEVETSLKATETRLALVEEDRDLRVQILTNALGTEQAALADRLAEAEKERDALAQEYAKLQASVAEVEKERDAAVRAHKASADLWWKQKASMDRAREKAQWIVNLPTEEDGGKLEDACDAAWEVARLLSGDE